MTTGQIVLLVAVALVVVFGAIRLLTDGRFRGTHKVRGAEAVNSPEATPASVLDGTPWVDQLGERATLLQFSSAFCAPCRATRHVLADVASRLDGVAHLEVDAEHHLEVVRRLGVMRTPTTIVLDAGGLEVTRAAGAPTRAQVLQALSGL